MTDKDTASSARRALFRHALPDDRLGQEHASLPAYRRATRNFAAPQRKEYTLIVVTGSGGGGSSNNKIQNRRKILLGQKHRGFGKGFYNSFGGKVEEGEAVAVGAARELHEETGIAVAAEKMQQSRVGTLHFTFQDGSVEMVVHLFRIRVSFDKLDALDNDQVVLLDSPSVIRGCEEITPIWFDDWREVPLNKMFADDTVWLTNILEAPTPLLVDAWFHFLAGGQETNTIMHYYLDLKEQEPHLSSDSDCSTEKGAAAVSTANGIHKNDEVAHLSLEKRLFHALHDNSVTSPSIKEFNESFACLNAVRSAFGQSRNQRRKVFDYVIDVAGGHGALAALFLLTTSAHTATVVDPARVGQIRTAWGDFLQANDGSRKKSLRFRHECLRTGLPAELALALRQTRPDRILVVACHACQHLSDEVLEISRWHGVHAAVMPCCQKDPTPGSNWKAASQKLGIPIEKTMDLLLAGKCMTWDAHGSYCYDVRMKFIDATITPQNRIIVCRAVAASNENNNNNPQQDWIARAHRKLEKAYRRAHADTTSSSGPVANTSSSIAPAALSLLQDVRFLGGTAFGFLLAVAVFRR